MRLKLLILLVVLVYACKKSFYFRNFEFHFPATITAGDTFSIGDTLWIEMNLPNELVDHQTGELINLSEFNLYLEFSVNRMDTTFVNNAINDFDLIEKEGFFQQERQGRFLVTYTYFKSILEKKLHLGVVPKKAGVYSLSLSLPVAYALAEESTDPDDWVNIISCNCKQGIAELSGTRFEGGAFNYYLVKQYPCVQSSFDNTTICYGDSVFMAHGGGHAFVVR